MISVIVANHNGVEHLARCLSSVVGSELVTEVLLVDNNSRDGSLELVKSQFPSVTLLDQETNLGLPLPTILRRRELVATPCCFSTPTRGSRRRPSKL